MGLRDAVKAGIERGLILSGTPGRRIRGGSSQTVILSYHNVVPSGERAVGDLSLHIEQRRFGEHLDRLSETHDVVALSALNVGESNTGRPRAVVTFDDAYLGAISAGFDELRRRDMPSTVFVPPGCLGGRGFWWDRIAAPGEGLPEAARHHALQALGGRGDSVEAWAAEQGIELTELPAHARPATRADLLDAARRARSSLGSHTWSHVNLVGVPLDEARAEIGRAHGWLDDIDQGVVAVDWLAYPYGLYSPAVAAVAGERVGHAVRVEGGAAEVHGRWTADTHRLPRINVPAGLSADGLVLRLAGMR